MAAQKKGLGRGLDALLEPYTVEEGGQNSGILTVSIRLIDTNREQPRKTFDETALNELAESIRTHGIIQPLIVKETAGRYRIIAGERRFRAARIAGLEQIPVIPVQYDDETIHEVALIENIQREDLNPIEEAAAMRFLMKQHDLTQEEVSSRIGKSRPTVANALRLLNLPERVMKLVKEGTLSAGHGRALAGLEDKKLMETLADETVRLGYSVRALESSIRNLSEKKPRKTNRAEKQPQELVRAEKTMREKLGTRVKIQGDTAKGKIVIDYYSAEDLSRVYEAIIGDCEE